jgi:hypothetical protein
LTVRSGDLLIYKARPAAAEEAQAH